MISYWIFLILCIAIIVMLFIGLCCEEINYKGSWWRIAGSVLSIIMLFAFARGAAKVIAGGPKEETQTTWTLSIIVNNTDTITEKIVLIDE